MLNTSLGFRPNKALGEVFRILICLEALLICKVNYSRVILQNLIRSIDIWTTCRRRVQDRSFSCWIASCQIVLSLYDARAWLSWMRSLSWLRLGSASWFALWFVWLWTRFRHFPSSCRRYRNLSCFLLLALSKFGRCWWLGRCHRFYIFRFLLRMLLAHFILNHALTWA